MDAEKRRLVEAARRTQHWRRWGPYLAERAWGTVREDYSPYGTAWEYFPFEHSHLRAYRWGEDGIAGICDNHQRLCFAPVFWNTRDPILKERLFGLTAHQGNHGEDVKEVYYYLDATPTHSYLKCLYKYPQAEFPYSQLVNMNGMRGRDALEYELIDTGIFNEDRYFDIFIEYAKVDSNDIVIRVSITNRGPDRAPLHVSYQRCGSGTRGPGRTTPNAPNFRKAVARRSMLKRNHSAPIVSRVRATRSCCSRKMTPIPAPCGAGRGCEPYVKDGFHRRIIHGQSDAVNPSQRGTKACAWYRFDFAPGQTEIIHLRLTKPIEPSRLVHDVHGIFAERIAEADEFYSFAPATLSADGKRVQRQAFAGLLWSKQFYHYVVAEWLKGDPAQPPPPPSRLTGRNSRWVHLYNEDVISMPDKWEYPWYAAWDLGFHMVPMALVDPDFAKWQLRLLLREWYMHPNGQIPAYEWAFGDVNPPVHAWACWRTFQIDRKIVGRPDYPFLESVFHKLLLNFTWWINRKDASGSNIFEGVVFPGVSTTSESSTVPRRCPPAATSSNPTEPVGWRCFASTC